MVNYNPNFPEVLGNEFLMTHDQKTRVWAGSAARMQRLVSTTAETITALKLSASLNPLVEASIPTIVDVFQEGNEFVGNPKVARLSPNRDDLNEGWTRSDGSTTSLFMFIDDSTLKWPTPNTTVETQWVRVFSPTTAYSCGVNASLFNTGGAAQNGRVFWLGVDAIFSANTGFRKLGLALRIDGVLYPPAAGGVRDVHGYGQKYSFWWGEINPATDRPWTPSDIAKFDLESDCGIFVRSQGAATATHYPKINALSMNVAYLETENRVAVATWNRPEDVGTTGLQNITTDSLRTVPAGTTNWSKPTGQNHVYFWRQSISPSQYGPVVADDVRWNGGYQDLGPNGNPPGVVYPLQTSGTPPPPSTSLASVGLAYDTFGRPQSDFNGASRATYALALVRSDAAMSVDSQPYRCDVTDLEKVTSTQKLGQRLVPGSTQSYLGVRFPIIPPGSGNPTLTVAVVRVSDSVQMGGTFTITASAARTLRKITKSQVWVFISGFLSSSASLVSGTAYELRFTTTSGGEWTMAVPDCSLAPTTGFGGTTNGAFIGATHDTNRDLAANLVRQPDPPTGATATIINVPVTTYLSRVGLPTVQHVRVSWTLPAVGMASLFKRYELERTLDAGTSWHRIANINNSAITSRDNREVPRDTAVKYRIRAVGLDGRFSNWAETNTVTPTGVGEVVIFTSDHDQSKEVVYFFDHESTYPILSAEGTETHRLYGEDLQVVFTERENRGVGWHTSITIDRVTISGKGGHHILTPLLSLIQSLDIPYVCVLDDRGTHLMGHVEVAEPTRNQLERYYTAEFDVIPTHSVPVSVEVF